MEKNKVSIERHVEQVLDGIHYKGYVKIAGTKFDYELVLSIPIPLLNKAEPAKDEDEVRSLFQLTVKRDNVNIELTNKEYCVFFIMIMEFAEEFYKLLRKSNKGRLGEILRGEEPRLILDGMTRTVSCDFPPELCKILGEPKFGCALEV